MRKIALFTVASLVVIAALPANATLADRKSDEHNTELAEPAPYSGQTVIRGEVRSEVEPAQPALNSGQAVIRGQVQSKAEPAEPAPYSDQTVIRGQVRSEGHG